MMRLKFVWGGLIFYVVTVVSQKFGCFPILLRIVAGWSIISFHKKPNEKVQETPRVDIWSVAV